MAALMLACPSTLVPTSDRVCGVQLPAKCSLPFAVLSRGTVHLQDTLQCPLQLGSLLFVGLAVTGTQKH